MCLQMLHWSVCVVLSMFMGKQSIGRACFYRSSKKKIQKYVSCRDHYIIKSSGALWFLSGWKAMGSCADDEWRSSTADVWWGEWSPTVTCPKGKMPFKFALKERVRNGLIHRLPDLLRMNKHPYPAPALWGNVRFSFPFNSGHCSLKKHLAQFWKVGRWEICA